MRLLGCFTLPRFEYAITYIMLFLFVFLLFFRPGLVASLLTQICFASNKFIIVLPKSPRRKLITNDRGSSLVAGDHGKLSVDPSTPFYVATFLIKFYLANFYLNLISHIRLLNANWDATIALLTYPSPLWQCSSFVNFCLLLHSFVCVLCSFPLLRFSSFSSLYGSSCLYKKGQFLI